MNELLTMSATRIAALIRNREVSPVEVLDAHITRIEQVNPAINALVVDRFAAARREARDAEDAVVAASAPEELPSLFGVPCTIKDFIAVTGMPQTGGLVSRKDYISKQDATVVDRLRDAGAIVMGVTNVPEGGMWMETHNNVYGRTNNPWNLKRTAGGSSGGEGALIAAGGSPFGIGSDIAGSVRIPAAFCGIVSHKPTGRMVPNTGHWGADGLPAARFLTCGPLARYVEDLPLLLTIIAGPDGRDRAVLDWKLGYPSDVDMSEVVVYPVTEIRGVRLSASYRDAVNSAAAALEALGAEVRELNSKLLRRAFQIWARAMSERTDTGGFVDVLREGQPLRLWRELARSVVGRSDYTFPALGLVALEKLADRVPAFLADRIRSVEELRTELESELGESGVILYPPYSRPAPRHSVPMLTPFDFICTGVFNITEFPASVVPTGFDGGLPVAVQIAARRGNDPLTLAVAGALEDHFGPWTIAMAPGAGGAWGQAPRV